MTDLRVDPNIQAELVWVDVETTGLEHDIDCLLEVGVVLTDRWGTIRTSGTWIINEPGDKEVIEEFLLKAEPDNYVLNLHQRSGLWKAWAAGHGKSLKETQGLILDFLSRERLTPGVSPMCGSSVLFDRQFLQINMRGWADWFHYRNIDVSTIREIARLVNPRIAENEPTKAEIHRPVPDLMDSIALYRYYLDNFFFIPSEAESV